MHAQQVDARRVGYGSPGLGGCDAGNRSSTRRNGPGGGAVVLPAAPERMFVQLQCRRKADRRGAELQKDISERLEKAGQKPESVTCKDDLEGEVGKTTRCEVALSPTTRSSRS